MYYVLKLLFLIPQSYFLNQAASSEFVGKTFQDAQLTHERFLTIDHSCKICFDICQTELPVTSGV